MEPGLRQQPASVMRSTRQSPDLGPAPRRLVQPGMDAPATAPAAAQGEGSPHAQRRAAMRVLAELAAIVGDSPGPSAPAGQTPPVSPATLPASPVPNRPRLTSVVNLGPRNAAEFASSHISEHLATAPPGARALALADGVESSGAGTWAVDHPHILSYSADYDYREAKETVDLWGVAYTRLRIDHTKPLDAARLDESDKPFSAVMMLRGLCDHYEWKDRQGNDAGAVGCAGVPLTASGVNALLCGVAPLLSDRARFALHGEINAGDRRAEYSALQAPVQANILDGVELFNQQVGRGLASVHVGESGLVIAGETVEAFSTDTLNRFRSVTDGYFAQDRALTCDKYPNQSVRLRDTVG
jgi:hypothetical protein